MRTRSIRACVPCRSWSSEGFDRAWNALHGPGGEDGLMQGALEWLGIPYTGSGVLASALTMDKLKTKRVVVGAGLAAPRVRRAVESGRSAARARRHRAADDGQARLAGLERRHHQGEERGASCRARMRRRGASTRMVFAERFIAGDEFTVGVLQDRGLPSIRIEPATEFYDYEAKYFRNDTKYHCPSGLDDAGEAELQAAALASFRVTDCFGWGRVDFMRETATKKFYFIEINTTPGMTDHSLVPMAARARRDRFRGARVARAGNEFHERAQMNLNLAHPPQSVQESREGRQAGVAVAEVPRRLADLRAPRGDPDADHRSPGCPHVGARPAGAA